ncbi:MAG: 30S ribosomal protein S19 [Methanomassiliicoccales archaeon]
MAKDIKGGTKASRRKARKKKGAIQARRKKEFAYRGYSLDELKEMPFDDLITLMPSRVRRTLTRGLNEEQQRCYDRLRDSADGVVRTHRRDVPVMPQFVGKRVAVYDGKEFKEFEIKSEMIGHYLGEFAQTRGIVRHSGPGVGATRSSKFLPLK